jgi:metallo-beta-lactamase superfamily exported protein
MNFKKTLCLLLALIFIMLSGCNNIQHSNRKTPDVTGKLNVDFLSVGKADAIILSTSNHSVLIDTGEKGDADEILNVLHSKAVDSIDYLFITHFDKDHVGGASKIIKNITVENIVTPNYVGNNNEYEKYIKTITEEKIDPVLLTANMSFVLDDVLFEVYPPLEGKYEESDNDYSLAISVTHGNNKMLFAGDAEQTRLKEFDVQFDLEHKFLKVPHHGVYNDYTKTFLHKVKPEFAVITCSKKNPPDDETLELLKRRDCITYLTSDGNVEIESDGKIISAK